MYMASEILTHFMVMGVELTHDLYEWAARHGHLDMLQGMCVRVNVCSVAVRAHQLHIVEWLHNQGICQCDLLEWAGVHGDLDLLRVACDCTGDPYLYAAVRGDFELLKYTHATAPRVWDGSLCDVIAAIGNLQLLKWVRARGCSWGRHTNRNAIVGGHIDIFAWVIDNGGYFSPRDYYLCEYMGYSEIIKWVQDYKMFPDLILGSE
jgi:hypothetical protein